MVLSGWVEVVRVNPRHIEDVCRRGVDRIVGWLAFKIRIHLKGLGSKDAAIGHNNVNGLIASRLKARYQTRCNDLVWNTFL
jgi:hypothetical protein